MNAIRTTLSIFAISAAAAAQADWTAATSGTPSARAALVYGSDLSGMVIFGGNQAAGRINEIWRFDGTAWTNLTPASGPAPIGRHWGGGTVDFARQKFVVFGGTNDNTNWLGDTWEFDLVSGTWTDLTPANPANSPSARRWTAMAYDAFRGECVLYGGVDQSGTFLSDTWVWNGSTWTQKFPAISPGPLARHKMVNKLFTTDTVLFGGRPTGSTTSGRTWTWDGTGWSETVTTTIPGNGTGLFEHGMAYDEIRDRVIVYGGVITSGTRGETFEFDGVDWVQRPNLPANSRSGPAMAYVQTLGTTFVYGGFENVRLDDTWSYQTDAIASSTPGTTGQGCAGNNGMIPVQNVVSLPWMDDTFEIAVTGLAPTSASKVVCLNFAAPIAPIPLAILGFPQCQFLADPALAFPLSPTDTFSVAVPNLSGNKGLAFYTQAVGLELVPAAIAASDRLDSVIGVR